MKKTVLITGASSGIGEACAKIYAQSGYDLVITGRRRESIEALAKELEEKHGISVRTAVFDIRCRKSCEEFTKELTEDGIVPDIFVNNAGLARGKDPIQEGSIDDWEEMIDTNVKGLLYVSRGILNAMYTKGTGHVINIGSIAGYQVYPGGNVYNATKFAVRALSDAMNLDLINSKIRVTCIEPGAANTEFSIVRFHGNSEMADDVYKGYTPLTASDIAQIIYFVTGLPEHINIQHLLVTPTAQRSSAYVNKSGLN